MKSVIKRSIAVILACVLVLACLVGCSSKGKKLMELEKSEITVNMFMLLMSRMKGTLAATLGTKVNTNTFWSTVVDAKTGQTYDEYYKEKVLDSAKTYIAALALFDELELELPDSYIEEIDLAMDELVESVGEGSKTYLNSVLADYGANYKVLRETYIMEAKIAYLSDHLFGANGSLISEENYEEYYQETYVRFKHVFFYNTKPVYETDENGDVIYYKDLSADPMRIAYKTQTDDESINLRKKTDADGNVLKDKNGDVIWIYTDADGKDRVSYDKGSTGNPTYPNALLDEDGYTKTEKLSTEEAKALSDEVQYVMESVKEGEYSLFDKYVEEYGEDPGMDAYPNGCYLTATSNYDSTEVRDALFEMEVGEIRRIESDYGIHIVMKYELDEGGYAKEENKDFFRKEDGSFSFIGDIKNKLLGVYLEKYKEDIVIKEDLLDSLSMTDVKANYNY